MTPLSTFPGNRQYRAKRKSESSSRGTAQTRPFPFHGHPKKQWQPNPANSVTPGAYSRFHCPALRQQSSIEAATTFVFGGSRTTAHGSVPWKSPTFSRVIHDHQGLQLVADGPLQFVFPRPDTTALRVGSNVSRDMTLLPGMGARDKAFPFGTRRIRCFGGKRRQSQRYLDAGKCWMGFGVAAPGEELRGAVTASACQPRDSAVSRTRTIQTRSATSK